MASRQKPINNAKRGDAIIAPLKKEKKYEYA